MTPSRDLLAERIEAASWWAYSRVIECSLDSVGVRAETLCVMRNAVIRARDAERPPQRYRFNRAFVMIEAYRPWDRASFERAAEAVLEVCP